jgi:hypothetical protein
VVANILAGNALTGLAWCDMNELVFEVTQENDGGFSAECLSENIFTQADTWDALRHNAIEAVRAFFFDQPKVPRRVRLHLVRDELLASE